VDTTAVDIPEMLLSSTTAEMADAISLMAKEQLMVVWLRQDKRLLILAHVQAHSLTTVVSGHLL
jgi:hypothetical protein